MLGRLDGPVRSLLLCGPNMSFCGFGGHKYPKGLHSPGSWHGEKLCTRILSVVEAILGLSVGPFSLFVVLGSG